MSVTPVAGTNTKINLGATAVIAAPANVNGGYITNPALASDQGIAIAESLLVSPVTPPSLIGNTTAIRLQPGETYMVIPGSVNPVWVNATTTGHKFTCVVY